MIKKLGVLAAILLALGTGATLYLPKYPPAAPATATFQLVEKSLKQPLNPASYQPSSSAFQSDTSSEPQYALQLGIFASLENATTEATQLHARGVETPGLPVIFKVKDSSREWYLLVMGPYASQDEAQQQSRKLALQNIPVQFILWPVVEEKPGDPPKES